MEIIEFVLKFFLFCMFPIMIFAALFGGTYIAERLIFGKQLTPDELDELISKDVEEMLQRDREREIRKGVIVEFIEDLPSEKHDDMNFEEDDNVEHVNFEEHVDIENEKHDDMNFEEDLQNDNVEHLNIENEEHLHLYVLQNENNVLKGENYNLHRDIDCLTESNEQYSRRCEDLVKNNQALHNDIDKLKQELVDKDVKYRLLEEKLNTTTRDVENKKRGIMNKDKLMMMMAMGGMNPNGNQTNGGMNPMMMAMMMGGKKDKGGFVENGKGMFDGIADKFMPSQIEGGMSFAGDVVIGGHGIKVVKDEEGTVDVKLIETCGLEIDMPLYVVPTPRANVQKGQIVILQGKDGKQRGVVVTEIGEGKLKGVDFANGNNRNINLLDNALGLDMLNVVFNPMGDAFAQNNGENNGLMGGMNPMMMMLMMGDE